MRSTVGQRLRWSYQTLVTGSALNRLDVLAYVKEAREYNHKMIRCFKAGAKAAEWGYRDCRDHALAMARTYRESLVLQGCPFRDNEGGCIA